jgi:hypothetical protein
VLCSASLVAHVASSHRRRTPLVPGKFTYDPERVDARIPEHPTLHARFLPRQQRYLAGEPIWANFLFTNDGKDVFSYWEASGFDNHRLDVWDSQGRAAELTDKGRQWRKWFGTHTRRRNFPVKITPNTTYDPFYPDGTDIRRTYNLPPGRYTARFIYWDSCGSPEFQVVSPAAEFLMVDE